MLHFPSSSHPSPHALVVVLSKKLMNAKLFGWGEEAAVLNKRWHQCPSHWHTFSDWRKLDISWQQACFLIFGSITYLFTQGLLWNGTCANQSATYSPLFPTHCTKAVELAQEIGASAWLTALPIAENGFVLHKGAFHDAICLHYRWRPPLLPSQCVCGRNFTAEHALSCHYDGAPLVYTTMRLETSKPI